MKELLTNHIVKEIYEKSNEAKANRYKDVLSFWRWKEGVFGSSSAGLVHHPPHQEHDVDQDPLKMTGEIEKQYS